MINIYNFNQRIRHKIKSIKDIEQIEKVEPMQHEVSELKAQMAELMLNIDGMIERALAAPREQLLACEQRVNNKTIDAVDTLKAIMKVNENYLKNFEVNG